MTEAETSRSTGAAARGAVETALHEVADMLAEMRRMLDSGESVPRRLFIGALEAAEGRVNVATNWLDALPGEAEAAGA